jgi:VanZ family protein
LKAILALIIWTVFITVFSLIPVDGVEMEVIPFQDKLIHFVFYTVLAYLLLYVLKPKSLVLVAIVAFIVSSSYGFLMECLQYLLNTGRYFDNFDIIVNIIGSLTGSLLFYFFPKN